MNTTSIADFIANRENYIKCFTCEGRQLSQTGAQAHVWRSVPIADPETILFSEGLDIWHVGYDDESTILELDYSDEKGRPIISIFIHKDTPRRYTALVGYKQLITTDGLISPFGRRKPFAVGNRKLHRVNSVEELYLEVMRLGPFVYIPNFEHVEFPAVLCADGEHGRDHHLLARSTVEELVCFLMRRD